MAHPHSEPEHDRLAVLRAFCILDTPPEPAFDDLTTLAAQICAAPVALISLIDEERQWFKSKIGWDAEQTAREHAFCDYAIQQEGLLVAPDAAADPRFARNPLVTGEPGIRFYAGAPLITADGCALGALCVMDYAPRQLTAEQANALSILSRQVVHQLELRRSQQLRMAAERDLEKAISEIERRAQERIIELEESRSLAEATSRRAGEIIERISDGVIGLDSAWRFTYLNWQAGVIFGRSTGNLLGSTIWDALPEGLGDEFRRDVYHAAEEQVILRGQKRFLWHGRNFETRIYPTTEGVSIFLQDVTELERERAQSEAIIQGLPSLFYLFNTQGKFLRWNERTLAETGYTAEEYQQKRPLELIAEADRAATAKAITEGFTTGDALIEARLLTKDGDEPWRLFSGRRITYHGMPCLVGLGIDITAQKRVEAALRDASTSLELSIQASGIGLWDWALETSTVTYSPQWKTILGYEGDEIANDQSEWRQRIHPDDRAAAEAVLADYVRHPEGDYRNEYRLRHRNGSYRWIQSQGKLFRDDEGRPWRMMGCLIDVTERRGMEEQLRGLAAHLQSARDEEGERIARELHDELGATLTGMKLDISWLDRHFSRLVPAEEVGPIRERLRTISETIDATVRSVRKVCRDLRPGVLDQLGLAAGIEWQAAEFQTRTGIACHLALPEALEVEPSQATAIFRMIQELLTNVARHAGATEVRIDVRYERKDLVIEVVDNGGGLPPDALSRSDRFGLMGLRERAIAAGGAVDFQSAPASGTRALIRIPRP